MHSSHRVLRGRLCEQRQRLLRIAWSWCNNPALADDLVQETLARALAKLHTLRNEERLEAWVTRIMVNLYRDQHRREDPVAALDFDIASDAATPEQAIESRDLVLRVRHAMRQLSLEQRQIIALVDLSEFSYADTAHILDVPVGTVMSRLWRARKNLRRHLERQVCQRHELTRCEAYV